MFWLVDGSVGGFGEGIGNQGPTLWGNLEVMQRQKTMGLIRREKRKNDILKTHRHSVEVYVITVEGTNRTGMRSHESLSYEGAQILDALMRHGKSTIGELADTCPHLSSPALREQIYNLIAIGFIGRSDKII
jgi:hypothetical protein